MIRIALPLLIFAVSQALASDLDEFKVKRQEIFQFTEKPSISRDGDTVTIRFASKGFCDATIAIEDPSSLVAGYPRIVHHLASGVLGPKAPAPFQKDSLRQVVVWDGKNDQGEYIDNKEVLTVRVSLGLKPSFEKNLFWEPKRRHGVEATGVPSPGEPPILQATAEGVYVYEGGGALYSLRLFGHDGQYIRTVYPFPADKIGQVKGLHRQTFPADGLTLPVKPTYTQQTFLTCGNIFGYQYPPKYALGADIIHSDGDGECGMGGNAASVLAVSGLPNTAGAARRLALAKIYLWRMASDGSSGGLDVEGPAVCLYTTGRGDLAFRKKVAIAPHSGALSPDGKWLYLTGYNICHRAYYGATDWQTYHCVMKIDVAGDKPAQLFAGADKIDVFGNDNKSFKMPVSVAVDNQGRVYVADHMNDRVQIFAPDGTFLKSLSVHRPGVVSIDGKSQDIYVFTSRIPHTFIVREPEEMTPQLTVFGPFDNPTKKQSCPLPPSFGFAVDYTTIAQIRGHAFCYEGMGFPFSAAVDGYTTPPTVWMAQELISRGHTGCAPPNSPRGIGLFTLEAEGLKPKTDFAKDVAASVKRATPSARPRLVVNPKTGKVYVMEADAGLGGCKTLLELDPEGGPIRPVDLPFDAEDMCFDTDGMVYLRTFRKLARYDPGSWREIPWDYGEECPHVSTSDGSDRKAADLISALPLPANGIWHHGGMYISPRGHLAVGCGLELQPPSDRRDTTKVGAAAAAGKLYAPMMFPGRNNSGRAGAPLIHVWDRHGKLIHEDAVPGLAGSLEGLGLDRDDNVYFMAGATRMIDGKPYMNNVLAGTLMKAVPGKPRLLSQSPRVALPLPAAKYLKRPVDLGGEQGPTWAEGVEWMYGGVSWAGKNAPFSPACGCWNAHMAFDYFARSFAPELQRYSIAVLDSNGNLILHIGQYGNCDSAGPKSLVPLGGDEVGMVHGAYLATFSDCRLFVADIANDRIFSVKLAYAAEEKVVLKDVKGR